MIFDLDEDQSGWFDLEDGGRMRLRLLTPDDWKSIKKKTVKKKADFKKVEGVAGRFEYEETDDELQNELIWDAMIVAWENFFDKNKNEIPCTKENKLLLMHKSAKFSRFVIDSLKELQTANELKAEVIEKN